MADDAEQLAALVVLLHDRIEAHEAAPAAVAGGGAGGRCRAGCQHQQQTDDELHDNSLSNEATLGRRTTLQIFAKLFGPLAFEHPCNAEVLIDIRPVNSHWHELEIRA